MSHPSTCSFMLIIVCHSFFMIAFMSYVESQDSFNQSFSGWLKVRNNQIICDLQGMITVTPIADQDRDLEVSLVLLLTPYFFSNHNTKSSNVSTQVIWFTPQRVRSSQRPVHTFQIWLSRTIPYTQSEE